MWNRLRLVVLLAFLGLVAVGCADEATGPGATGSSGARTSVMPTEDATPTGSSGPMASVEPTESPEPTPAPELGDGRHFGDIVSIDVPTLSLRLDLAYFLTGDEATQAAEEHGDEAPPPNDYYIVNDNPRLRTLAIDPNVEVWVIDWGSCCELMRGELQPFADAFATAQHAWDAMYQGSESWYWLTVRDGSVVRIEEQYLP